MFQTGLKKWVILCCVHLLLVIFVISEGEEVVGTFYEKELQETIQKEFTVDKVIKRKAINYMSSGKATIIILTVGLIKKTYYR